MSDWNETCSQAPCNKPMTPEEALMNYRDAQSDTALILTIKPEIQALLDAWDDHYTSTRDSLKIDTGPEEY